MFSRTQTWVCIPFQKNAYPLTKLHFQLKIVIFASKIGNNVECHRLILSVTLRATSLRSNIALVSCFAQEFFRGNIHVFTYPDMGVHTPPEKRLPAYQAAFSIENRDICL